jgi:hypothetical protein
MRTLLSAAEIVSDDECSTGTWREHKGKLQIVWDDGVIQTVTSVRMMRVFVDDHRGRAAYEEPRRRIAVEIDDGEVLCLSELGNEGHSPSTLGFDLHRPTSQLLIDRWRFPGDYVAKKPLTVGSMLLLMSC